MSSIKLYRKYILCSGYAAYWKSEWLGLIRCRIYIGRKWPMTNDSILTKRVKLCQTISIVQYRSPIENASGAIIRTFMLRVGWWRFSVSKVVENSKILDFSNKVKRSRYLVVHIILHSSRCRQIYANVDTSGCSTFFEWCHSCKCVPHNVQGDFCFHNALFVKFELGNIVTGALLKTGVFFRITDNYNWFRIHSNLFYVLPS